MVVTFKVGCVYRDKGGIPFEVTRITGSIMWLRQVHDIVGGGLCQQIDLMYPRHGADSPGREESDWAFRPRVAILDARKFHCLHPWFPSGDSLCKAYLRDDPNLPDWLHRFHKKIMKTFVFFFISVKFVVLARRAKRVVMERMERMYAPGGIGFVAAQESFYRAAKSQRIE